VHRVGGAVTFVSGSNATCTIDANQAGNATWNAAPQVARSFTITPGNQTISFGPLANKLFGAAPFNVSAIATSHLPVTFTSLTPSVCAVTGSTVTVLGPGTCTIQASQPGSADFQAASPAFQSFTVVFSSSCITTKMTQPLTVKAGQAICVNGGTLGMGVTVQPGGALWVSNGIIKSSLNASGATALTLCDSAVSGSLTVTGSTGLVSIGGSACRNNISGSVFISKNTGGVTYTYDAANGSLTITGNSGGFTYNHNTTTGTVTLTGNI
jgi:hypothetical protein